jgi:hypothetical protein
LDVFLERLEVRRGQREVVLDRDHRYKITGEEIRTSAATGALPVWRGLATTSSGAEADG